MLREAARRLYAAADGTRAVEILAIVSRASKPDEVVLVEQFRPPLNGMSIELPAGLVDGCEEPVSAAVRELLEECGLHGSPVNEQTLSCAYEPGLSSARMQLIRIDVDGDLPENASPQPRPEPGEHIHVHYVPKSALLTFLQGLLPVQRSLVLALTDHHS